jgi:MinD superfamily P-loop ATPase
MNCGKKVFAWEDGKSKVVNPTACVVGCTTCANLCQGQAISFPPLSELRAFYKEHKIWAKVKRAMEESGVIPRRSPAHTTST